MASTTHRAADADRTPPPRSRHGLRHRVLRRGALELGAVTAGLIGVAGASWMALLIEARAASAAIEQAARTAALAHGLLPTDAVFRWQDNPPDGDGTYLPSGMYVPNRTYVPSTNETHGENAASAGARIQGNADSRGENPRDEPPIPANETDLGRAAVLSVLGDSTSVGYGCSEPSQVPGVLLARAAAASLGRPVRLHSHGVVGSVSADLAAQLEPAIADAPDAAVIMVGANDVRDRVPPRHAAAQLERAVAALHAEGIAVVVGTCPDLGVIVPIRQPLRRFAGAWSRRLARFQEQSVQRAGGVAVALDRLVSPDFYGRPDLFYADGFHPSALGYAKATAALTPAVVDALRGSGISA